MSSKRKCVFNHSVTNDLKYIYLKKKKKNSLQLIIPWNSFLSFFSLPLETIIFNPLVYIDKTLPFSKMLSHQLDWKLNLRHQTLHRYFITYSPCRTTTLTNLIPNHLIQYPIFILSNSVFARGSCYYSAAL